MDEAFCENFRFRWRSGSRSCYPKDNRKMVIRSDADRRLYLSKPEGWQAVVKPNAVKEYCYFKDPGDEHFHLLVLGEVYLQRGDEKCCLNCALRHDIVTSNRQHWQRVE